MWPPRSTDSWSEYPAGATGCVSGGAGAGAWATAMPVAIRESGNSGTPAIRRTQARESRGVESRDNQQIFVIGSLT